MLRTIKRLPSGGQFGLCETRNAMVVAIGCPWVSWHTLRRTFATLSDAFDMELSDRIASMGHSNVEMTMHYTSKNLERRRGNVEAIAERLGPVGAMK